MKHIADRFTATLDANVLYPFQVRDVLLTLADAGLFRPIWSAEIMREWSEHLSDARPEKSAAVARTVEMMNDAFPEASASGYEAIIDSLELPDPNDRHVLAVAIRTASTVIVTENLKDFPDHVVAPYDIEVKTADEFILASIQLYPTEAVAALRFMREGYTRPAMNGEEMLVALIAAGLVATAGELKPYLTSL
jgi:predicted nucleic acid-binding protein